MPVEEKAELFDLFVRALTNQWSNGKWSWWCRTPCGGPTRETREEAIQDLIEWIKRPINQGGSHVAMRTQSKAHSDEERQTVLQPLPMADVAILDRIHNEEVRRCASS